MERKRSPSLQRQQCVDMETSDVVHMVPDQLTLSKVTSNHVNSNHVAYKDNPTHADHGTIKNLSTIVEGSQQDSSELSINETSWKGEETVGQKRSNELIGEQSKRLQEILSIHEETIKILQLCKEKSKNV